MRKKGICFGLILALLLPFVFTTEVKASDNTELNIYAFYLNSEKGDSYTVRIERTLFVD